MVTGLLVNRFLNELRRRGASTNTLSAYATDLKQLAVLLHGTNVARLHHDDISARLKQWSQSFAPNSQSRKLTTAREFLRWCYRQGFTEENLNKSISIPKRQTVHPTRVLSPTQISRLRREATPLERVLLELILQTGMRLRDVVLLRSKHLSDRSVTIPSSGLKLPLAEPLQKALARYQMIRPVGDRSVIFSNTHGRPLSVRTTTTILKHLGKRAGVRDATARNLRTTFIVRQLEAGVSFPTIQKIVGFQTLGSLSSYQRFNAHQAQESRVAITEV